MALGYIAGIFLLAIVGFLVYKMAKEKKSLDDVLMEDATSFFKMIGAFSTVVEVISLSLSAVVDRDILLFSSLSRYGGLGILEVFSTFFYISIFSDALDEAAKDGRFTFLEIMKIIGKSTPFFIIGWCVTSSIWLLYLESIYRVELVIDPNNLTSLWKVPMIWMYTSVIATNYGADMETGVADAYNFVTGAPIISKTPEIGAMALIYLTPILNIVMTWTYIWSTMRKINHGEYEIEEEEEDDDDDDKTDPKPAPKPTPKPAPNPSPNPNPNPNPAPNPEPPSQGSSEPKSTPEVEPSILDMDVSSIEKAAEFLEKFFKKQKESGRGGIILDITASKLVEFAYKYAGIDPNDHSKYISFPGITNAGVSKWIASDFERTAIKPNDAMTPDAAMEQLSKQIVGSNPEEGNESTPSSGAKGIKYCQNRMERAKLSVAMSDKRISELEYELKSSEEEMKIAEGVKDGTLAAKLSNKIERLKQDISDHKQKMAAYQKEFGDANANYNIAVKMLHHNLKTINFLQ